MGEVGGLSTKVAVGASERFNGKELIPGEACGTFGVGFGVGRFAAGLGRGFFAVMAISSVSCCS